MGAVDNLSVSRLSIFREEDGVKNFRKSWVGLGFQGSRVLSTRLLALVVSSSKERTTRRRCAISKP